jgi:DNA repair photolyase
VNIAEVLRRELTRPNRREEGVAIGAATDPYQPAEGGYRLTRSCLEALRDASTPFSIITRGPLIVRDVDLLAEASRRAPVSVTFSVPTVDDDVWRTTEPGTAPPRQRRACAPRSGWRRSSPASPTTRASSSASSTRRARPARAACGRISSTCGRGRASTF